MEESQDYSKEEQQPREGQHLHHHHRHRHHRHLGEGGPVNLFRDILFVVLVVSLAIFALFLLNRCQEIFSSKSDAQFESLLKAKKKELEQKAKEGKISSEDEGELKQMLDKF